MQVRKSAIGSLTDMVSLPRAALEARVRRIHGENHQLAFTTPGTWPRQGQLPEADAAEPEIAQKAARPAAPVTAVVACAP